MRSVCLFASPYPFMQPVIRGVAACSKRVGPWRIECQFFKGDEDVNAFIKSRGFDGVLVTFDGPLSDSLRTAQVPVVAAVDPIDDLASVVIEDHAVGVLGAQHLVELGYRRFAFFGYSNLHWSRRRFEGFKSVMDSMSVSYTTNVDLSQPVTLGGAVAMRDGVDSFLDSLTFPTGLMVCHDTAARAIVDMAIERKIRVPGDLAVVGVDNDELLCETGSCPLSSIDPDLYRVGFEAALELDRRMRQEQAGPMLQTVVPKEVVRRQSTSLLSHSDPDIASALQFIYERACSGISVSDVCEHVAMSRRRLEQRFLKAVGQPPGDEIRYVRIGRAKALLTETRLSLSEISARCGYMSVSGFTTAFGRVVGVSPLRYRRQ